MVKNGDEKAIQDLQAKLVKEIDKLASDAYTLRNGIKLWDSRDISGKDLSSFINSLKSKLESLRNFNTCGKLKNVPFSQIEIESISDEMKEEHDLRVLYDKVATLNNFSGWFALASNTLPDDCEWNESYKGLLNDMDSSLSSLTLSKLDDFEKQMKFLQKSYSNTYSSFHAKSRLGTNENVKLSEITQSKTAGTLTKLKDVPILSAANLNAITNQLLAIKPCDGFTDDDLMKNPVCPHCSYSPKRDGVRDVRNDIAQLSSKLDDLLRQWTDSIFDSVGDPSIQENIDLLSPDKQKLVNDFITTKQIPDDIDSFVEALTDVFKGMVKKTVTLEDMRHDLLEEGKPLTIDELRANFEKLITSLCRGESPDKVRVVLE